MDINQELQKFNVTDAAISELTQKYMPLQINGIEDKVGYKAVKAARMIVKTYRVDVDKKRKELNSDALSFQRAINEEAKRITALLEPIEEHLLAQEKAVDEEMERIKIEKEAAELLKMQKRLKAVTDFGFEFHDETSSYIAVHSGIRIAPIEIKIFNDNQWDNFIDSAKDSWILYQEDIADKKRIEGEKQKTIKIRSEKLLELEFIDDSCGYSSPYPCYAGDLEEPIHFSYSVMQDINDDGVFDKLYNDAKENYSIFKFKKENERRLEKELEEKKLSDLKAEQDRITQQRRELEMERELLADIAREQEKEATRLDLLKTREEAFLLYSAIKEKEQENECEITKIESLTFSNVMPKNIPHPIEKKEEKIDSGIIILETYQKLTEYDECYKIEIIVEGNIISRISTSDLLRETPEDATLSRDIHCIFNARRFFKLGYEAGKNGESIIYVEKYLNEKQEEITKEEYYG